MKKIVLILITILLSVTLTGCRIKSGDSEIICDENGCTTNDESGTASQDEFDSDQPFAIRLINTAKKYVDYTRLDFVPIAAKYGFDIHEDENGKWTSWCAIFVSSMIAETNDPSWMNYKSASVSSFMSRMIKDNRFYHSPYWYNYNDMHKYGSDGKTVPQPGDIIFFVGDKCGYQGDGKLPDKTDTCFRHIGIVTEVDSTHVTYIHGNTTRCRRDRTKERNGVCISEEELNSSYIVGYGR